MENKKGCKPYTLEQKIKSLFKQERKQRYNIMSSKTDKIKTLAKKFNAVQRSLIDQR